MLNPIGKLISIYPPARTVLGLTIFNYVIVFVSLLLGTAEKSLIVRMPGTGNASAKLIPGIEKFSSIGLPSKV